MRLPLLVGCFVFFSLALGEVHPDFAAAPKSVEQVASTFFRAVENFDARIKTAAGNNSMGTSEFLERQKADHIASIKTFGEAIDKFVAFFNTPSEKGVIKLGEPARPRNELTLLELPFDKSGGLAKALEQLRQRFDNDGQVTTALMSLDGSLQAMRASAVCQRYFMAGAIFREMQFVDSASQNWEIEHGGRGELPKATDLVQYLAPGSHLRQTAENGAILDSFGNPITLHAFPAGPAISSRSMSSLSDLVTADFWKPCTPQNVISSN